MWFTVIMLCANKYTAPPWQLKMVVWCKFRKPKPEPINCHKDAINTSEIMHATRWTVCGSVWSAPYSTCIRKTMCHARKTRTQAGKQAHTPWCWMLHQPNEALISSLAVQSTRSSDNPAVTVSSQHTLTYHWWSPRQGSAFKQTTVEGTNSFEPTARQQRIGCLCKALLGYMLIFDSCFDLLSHAKILCIKSP